MSQFYGALKRHGTGEGERCNRRGCRGHMEFVRGGDGACYCHTLRMPPCNNCSSSVLRCDDCWQEA